MSFWKELVQKIAHNDRQPMPVNREPLPQEISPLADFLQVVEVNNASPFIGELFQRRFGCREPSFPRHFVTLYSQDKKHWQAIAYVHFTAYKNSFLCGGLVMDNHLYKEVIAPHRKIISECGGIAENLLKESFQALGECDAIWGYVGDKLAEKVDLRVGFVHTHKPHIMVVWCQSFSDKEKQKMIASIEQIGPF